MFILPPLPYDYDGLEPAVSSDTLEFHHDKHHKAYVDNTNRMLREEGRAAQSLEDVVRNSSGKLFNNAAQAWNHGFFWESMTPEYAPPAGDFATAIQSAYGDIGGLRKAFVEEGASHFASGWAWIVADEAGRLKVISTHDADTPIAHGMTPIIVCDVWEHAYYLDYQNDRKSFLETWFDKVANWRFAEKQLRAVMGAGEPYRYPAPEERLGQTTATADQGQTQPRPA